MKKSFIPPAWIFLMLFGLFMFTAPTFQWFGMKWANDWAVYGYAFIWLVSSISIIIYFFRKANEE